MADTDAAPAAGSAAPKKAKKTTKPKTPASHPKYSEMINAAIKSLKERGGSSRQAILKYITANYKLGNDSKQVNAHLRMALKRGVASGALKQAKGTGASGSFRVAEKAEKPKKAAVKKPKAAKPKAAGAKKAAKPKAAKKPAAKKVAKPKAAKKSPAKKAAKPKAAKKPATPKPKKATKPKAAKKASPKKGKGKK